MLDVDAAKCYENELNIERRTRLRRGGRWWINYLSPSHIKQEAIETHRSLMKYKICDWFARTISGYFAYSGLANSLPFAEMLCTTGEDVFKTSPPQLDFDWRRILINPAKYDIWTSQTTTPLRFVMDRARWPDDQRNLLVASLSVSSIPAERLKSYGGPNGVVHICNEELDGLLPFVAISAYLKETSRELKDAREGLRFSNSKRKTLRSINRIQNFFDRSTGVPVAAREILKVVEHPARVKYCCGSFSAPNNGAENVELDFAEHQRHMLHHEASTLLEDESSTREHFEKLASVLSIKESIGAQRRMELLTVAALLVAGLSLAAAWPESWGNIVQSWSIKAHAFAKEFRQSGSRAKQ